MNVLQHLAKVVLTRYIFSSLINPFLSFFSGGSQSDDDERTKQKKHSQTDLTQRSRSQSDFRNTAKEPAKSERTSAGTKRKALISRTGRLQIIKIKSHLSDQYFFVNIFMFFDCL